MHTGWGKVRERDNFEDLGIDGRTILKGIFKKWDRVMDCINLVRVGGGHMAGCFECGNNMRVIS